VSTRRIDTVVRIRRLQEQLASGELARSRQALAHAVHAEREAWDLVADRATHAAETPDALLAVRAKLDGGVTHAGRLGDRKVDAIHHADVAMHDWREAMQRLDGIERLSDKLTEQDRAEDERKSGVELDDLVVMRWERTS
jgi:hypothetical protein